MSDKKLVLDAIKRLPSNATLAQIRERVDFVAALKEAEQSLNRGEGIPVQEVEKQFSSWVKQWGVSPDKDIVGKHKATAWR